MRCSAFHAPAFPGEMEALNRGWPRCHPRSEWPFAGADSTAGRPAEVVDMSQALLRSSVMLNFGRNWTAASDKAGRAWFEDSKPPVR
jgi:hypothetical protein